MPEKPRPRPVVWGYRLDTAEFEDFVRPMEGLDPNENPPRYHYWVLFASCFSETAIYEEGTVPVDNGASQVSFQGEHHNSPSSVYITITKDDQYHYCLPAFRAQ